MKIKETSSTGTGAFTTAGTGEGVATKFAFKRKLKEVVPVASKYMFDNIDDEFKHQAFDKWSMSSHPLNSKPIDEWTLQDVRLWNRIVRLNSYKNDILTKNEEPVQLAEISQREYKKLTGASAKQKARNAHGLIRKKLREIDRILELNEKLREEVGKNWKLSEDQLAFLKEKTQSLHNKLRKLTK